MAKDLCEHLDPGASGNTSGCNNSDDCGYKSEMEYSYLSEKHGIMDGCICETNGREPHHSSEIISRKHYEESTLTLTAKLAEDIREYIMINSVNAA